MKLLAGATKRRPRKQQPGFYLHRELADAGDADTTPTPYQTAATVSRMLATECSLMGMNGPLTGALMERIRGLFDPRVTVGNVITIIAMAIGGFWVVAELRANDRLYEQRMTQIERKQDQLEGVARTIAEIQGDIRYLRQVIERRGNAQ